MSDELAYVTDPETQARHIVDLTNAEDGAEALVSSVELSLAPNETAVVSGEYAASLQVYVDSTIPPRDSRPPSWSD